MARDRGRGKGWVAACIQVQRPEATANKSAGRASQENSGEAQKAHNEVPQEPSDGRRSSLLSSWTGGTAVWRHVLTSSLYDASGRPELAQPQDNRKRKIYK